MCAPRPRFPAFRVPSTRPTGLPAPPAARTTAAAARSFGHLPLSDPLLARADLVERFAALDKRNSFFQIIAATMTLQRAQQKRVRWQNIGKLFVAFLVLCVFLFACAALAPLPAPPAACPPRTFAVHPSRRKPLSRPCVPRCFLCSYKLYVASRGNLALAGTALSVLVPLYYLATRVILS